MKHMAGKGDFESELTIFNKEQQIAQQYFLSYLSLRSIAASNSDVLRWMNATPLFWLMVETAMLQSMFIVLGRISIRSRPTTSTV